MVIMEIQPVFLAKYSYVRHVIVMEMLIQTLSVTAIVQLENVWNVFTIQPDRIANNVCQDILVIHWVFHMETVINARVIHKEPNKPKMEYLFAIS